MVSLFLRDVVANSKLASPQPNISHLLVGSALSILSHFSAALRTTTSCIVVKAPKILLIILLPKLHQVSMSITIDLSKADLLCFALLGISDDMRILKNVMKSF